MNKLIDMVKGKVRFVFAKDDALWYVTDCGFEFPVSYAETSGATFLPEDQGKFFMRWIRKECDRVEKKRKEVEAAKEAWEAEQKEFAPTSAMCDPVFK